MTKRMLLLATIAATLLLPAAATAAEGAFMVRLRALYLTPADKSDAIPSLSVPADAITVSKKLIPDVDVSYFFTPNLATELVLTYPQQHDVKLSGTKIGTFSHLPPTLTLQWHFLPDQLVNPYLGAGVNLTLITAQDINVPGVGELTLSKSSVGFAAQVGADVKIVDGWYANVDVKWVQIGVDVKAGGQKVSAVKVDPWLFGAGVGYRF